MTSYWLVRGGKEGEGGCGVGRGGKGGERKKMMGRERKNKNEEEGK